MAKVPLRLELTKNNITFLVTASPSESNIDEYMKMLKNKSVDLVIKMTNENLYDTAIYEKNNIKYIYFFVDDGEILTDKQIFYLLDIITDHKSICIHCSAGLGRAPLALALILILKFNQDPFSTIEEIRTEIPFAFNNKQINFLTKLKRSKYINIQKCSIM